MIMTAWQRTNPVSREELLQSIQLGMKLDKAFFLKIYGYELTWPGFKETAIKVLEDAGCSRAREYYDSVVGEYEKGYQEQIKEAGRWYLEECNREWEKKVKEGEVKRRKNRLSKETISREILKW